ncbi:MAG: hypothetical protein Q8P80_05655 [Candidatus Levybacteria bacterium]|nr:hypothetical protein [Candidatus Levybacteria bacterium]
MRINKIALDVANILLVFYELIKKDRPNLEGEELYGTVLQTWNLNLSKSQIEIREIIDKARRLDWGDDINLRKIAWALVIDEYFKTDRAENNLKEDIIFILKMRNEIEKIIPEGV